MMNQYDYTNVLKMMPERGVLQFSGKRRLCVTLCPIRIQWPEYSHCNKVLLFLNNFNSIQFKCLLEYQTDWQVELQTQELWCQTIVPVAVVVVVV